MVFWFSARSAMRAGRTIHFAERAAAALALVLASVFALRLEIRLKQDAVALRRAALPRNGGTFSSRSRPIWRRMASRRERGSRSLDRTPSRTGLDHCAPEHRGGRAEHPGVCVLAAIVRGAGFICWRNSRRPGRWWSLRRSVPTGLAQTVRGRAVRYRGWIRRLPPQVP